MPLSSRFPSNGKAISNQALPLRKGKEEAHVLKVFTAWIDCNFPINSIFNTLSCIRRYFFDRFLQILHNI